MRYIGVDLHKRTLSACVVSRETGRREVVLRRTIACRHIEQVAALLKEHAPCQVVVEATSSYEWFAALAEPLVDRVVLAHPAKLRVIAESTGKTDKLDAQVLAEFLAMDMIPEAHRPSPRIREHRALVRQRCYIQKRSTSVKNKLRWILAGYNASNGCSRRQGGFTCPRSTSQCRTDLSSVSW